MFLQTANLEISHIPLKKRNTTKHYHIIILPYYPKQKLQTAANSILLTYKYMAAYFSGLEQTVKTKCRG